MDKNPLESGIIAVDPATVEPKERLEMNYKVSLFPSKSCSKAQSRYLRAAIGSCHDSCKYGKKNVSEDEGKQAMFRRFMENRILSVSKHNEVNHMKLLNLNKEKKKGVMKPKDSLMPNPSPVKQHILKQKNASISAEITSGSSSNTFKEEVASYMKETVTSSALKVNNLKKMAVRKSSESPRFQSVKQNVSLPSRKGDSHVKPDISLKESAPLARPITQLNASRNLNMQRNWDRKVSKSFDMPKAGEIKLWKLRKASMSSTTPAHGVQRLKARKHRNLEHASHKRDLNSERDVGEAMSEKNSADGNDHNLNMEGYGCISDYAVSDVSELSESEEMRSKQKHRLSREEEKRRTRNPVLQLDDNSFSPYMLKFKRGTVIELGPMENISPRRLRFRRARVLDENPDGEGMNKIFRRRRDIHDMKAPSAAAHANSSKANSVVLKHQVAQEKKDMQALFNQVIEETASKLVETRKSKVKALVGAFETVISLQDTKATPVV